MIAFERLAALNARHDRVRARNRRLDWIMAAAGAVILTALVVLRLKGWLT